MEVTVSSSRLTLFSFGPFASADLPVVKLASAGALSSMALRRLDSKSTVPA